MRSLITQLETYYDRVLAGQGSEEETSLAPDVEKFLHEMTERFDDGRPGHSEDADNAE